MPILCYHAIQPDWSSPLAVSPPAFARHCAWLARRGRVLPLADLVDRMDTAGRLPAGLTALTFDDGFASIYEHAFPILGRYRLPATIFLVAATLVDGGKPVDWVDDQGSVPLRTLNRDQLREMRAAGITFGSHSYAHRDLTAMSEDECERDLRASREVLEDVLGGPASWLAYPRGRHDVRVRRAAQRAGFKQGFGLPDGPEPAGPFAVPRVGVYAGNRLLALRIKSSGWYLPLRMSRLAQLRRPQRRPPTVPVGVAS